MAKSRKCYDKITFLDDNKELSDYILGYEIIGKLKDTHKFIDEFTEMVIDIGNNEVIVNIGEKAKI